MARPRSEDRRNAIIAAATHVIANQGLAAPTALIAKEAGISNGSLFTYFETKADLFNQLYVELKTEMAAVASNGVRIDQDVRDQMAGLWRGRLRWATAHPEKRRALAQLAVSDEITRSSREVANRAMAGVSSILERSRQNGPMRAAPLGLVVNLMNAVSDATVDFIIHDPANAEAHDQTGFEAVWRMIA
jgi:AcrR family transcriptional regulator